MSGPSPAAPGSPRPGRACCEGLDSLVQRLCDSEAKRLELERKLMEYRKSDAYLMKLKYTKLKKYLKEIEERQKGALLRNQTFLKEFNEFEAHMKTSSSEMIQKMEARYGREIKSLLSLRGGVLSAEGDKEEEEYNKQMLWVGRQAGITTGAAVPRGLCHPQRSLAEDTRSSVGPKPSLSNGWTSKEMRWGSNAELTVPASAEEVMPSTSGMPWGTALPAASWELGKDTHTVEGSALQPPNPPLAQEEPSVSSAPDGPCGMLAGLSFALQLIEDVVVRTSPQHRALYQGEREGTMGSAELFSFCNRAGSLKEDDLEACEAVVLHQLQALSQSKLNGCLLPEKTLDAKGSAVDEKQTRPDQQWDMDLLQTCLSNHALFLKKHQVQLTKEVAEMFESLLASSTKAQDGQALPVLREVLPEECGDRSSLQSNESSYSLPSIPNDGGEIKQAKHAPRLADTGEQEVTIWCEDESKEESAVEKIPITGWDIGDNSSQAKESQDTNSETSSSANERNPPFSRTEPRKAMVSAIKSKAFWGESDESSSEIEAALRPQTHSTEADEFDDFYD